MKKLSLQGEALLKKIEQLRLKPYDDQTGKSITVWVKGATIGYGYLIPKREWSIYKDGITHTQADNLLSTALLTFEAAVNTSILIDVLQHQFDAAVLLAYNIGVRAFTNSSVVKLINNPAIKTRYASLEHAWKAWNKSQGVVNQGLINRRNTEWNIYSRAVYQGW